MYGGNRILVNENDLKALVVQVTGLEKGSQIVTKVVKSFEALNDFDAIFKSLPAHLQVARPWTTPTP